MTSNKAARQLNRVTPAAAFLWASAIILLALVLTQASRLGGPGAAYAGNVSEVGDLTVLTLNAGNSEDVLLVLDSRADRLMVYRVENNTALRLKANYTLSAMFQPSPPPTRRRTR